MLQRFPKTVPKPAFLNGPHRLRPGVCRVCGHRAIEPVVIRVPSLAAFVALIGTLLYLVTDLTHGGTIDGSPVRAVLVALGVT